MRIDLTDLERLDGIAEGLGRLFWCLMAVAFFAAIFGSAGTGLLVLILGAAAFVGREGIEDFLRSRREPAEPRSEEPKITVYRTTRAHRTAPKTPSRPRQQRSAPR